MSRLKNFCLIVGLFLIPTATMAQNSAEPGVSVAAPSGLGDVVYSMLSPELFAKTHSGRWMLLDGNALPVSSGLHTFLAAEGRLDLVTPGPDIAATVPDARGVFIRGLNLNRDPATGDPMGADRKAGSVQADQIGKHSHIYRSYRSKRSGLPPYDRFNAANDENRINDARTSEVGATSPTDTETRPKNIALYVYLKIGS